MTATGTGCGPAVRSLSGIRRRKWRTLRDRLDAVGPGLLTIARSRGSRCDEAGDDREHRELPADRVSLNPEGRLLRAAPGEHDEGDRSNAVWLT
jgi:hypothetical protein